MFRSEEHQKEVEAAVIALFGSKEKSREVLAWLEKNTPSLIERGTKELGVSQEAIYKGLEAYCGMTVLRKRILSVMNTLAEGQA